MNSLVMVDSIVSASVGCEAVTNHTSSSLPAGGEPKRAFADSPPLAKIRNESGASEDDLSKVSPESEVVSEQAVEWEPLPHGESPRQGEQEAPVEGEPARDLMATLTTEGLSGQGEVLVEAASMVETVNTTSATAETVPGETIIVNSEVIEGLPTLARGEPQVGMDAQDLANTENTVIESSPAQADMLAPAAKNSLETPQTATQAQGNEGHEKSLSEAGVLAPATGEGDQGTSVAEPGAAMARSQTEEMVGSDASTAAPDREGTAIPAAMETAEGGQRQSEQQASGENANGNNLESGQRATATPEMTGPDASGPLPEGEQVLARENSGNQPEGLTQAVVTDGQAKAEAPSNVEEASKGLSEFTIDSQSSISVSEPISTQADAVADGETASVKSPVQSVGEQILDSVQASLTQGDRQLVVRLDPPELGSVTVRFQEQDGQISAVLEVSKDQIRQEVEQALPQVLRGLQEANVLIRRVEVVVADQSDREMDRDSTPQDAWAQQDGSDQQDMRSGHSSVGRWSTWTDMEQDRLEQNEASRSQISAAQGRIDMLI